MASQYYTPKVRTGGKDPIELGIQPFNRDSIALAFGKHAKVQDGQDLAGTGALVFEGEVLQLPLWH